jgi:hypothetical protein
MEKAMKQADRARKQKESASKQTERETITLISDAIDGIPVNQASCMGSGEIGNWHTIFLLLFNNSSFTSEICLSLLNL